MAQNGAICEGIVTISVFSLFDRLTGEAMAVAAVNKVAQALKVGKSMMGAG